ncbi:hypothetical protein Ndes2437A_g00219 [Nannochloris sp. 'desiccata']
MIELVAGIYNLGDGQVDKEDLPNQGGPENDNGGGRPAMAVSGVINGRIGTTKNPIVFCGTQNRTIIDGADSVRYASSGIRILKSQHVRLAGFTVQNVLKGVDTQNSKDSDISYISIKNTLQEGIRIRYNSVRNTVRDCSVRHTGLMYAGVGEGIYIGSSRKNSIGYGLPKDESDYNIIQNNKFGPGVTAEAIDIKEYTSYGKVINNEIDGKDLSGWNGAISWIAVKGNGWTIQGNKGKNLKSSKFVGIKVVAISKGQGNKNIIKENRCDLQKGGSLCVFIAKGTAGNTIACSNIVGPLWRKATMSAATITKKLCNCKTRCLKASGRSSTLGVTPVLRSYYDADALFNVEEEAARPSWD